MTVYQALVLGITQGITEFLPVSSSGHLILIPYIFGWELQSLAFDVALHFGTTLAVIILFWKDWYIMCKTLLIDVKTGIFNKSLHLYTLRPQSKMLIIIVAVSVPVGIIALLFKDTVENIFRGPLTVAIMLIVVAIIMLIADRHAETPNPNKDDDDKSDSISFISSLIISLSQVLALIPGTSRSGITISIGIFRGLNREQAAKFSFLLATPLIIGATLIQLPDLFSDPLISHQVLFVGFVTSFIVGALAIKLLLAFLKTHRLTLFIIYRIILGIIIFGMIYIAQI